MSSTVVTRFAPSPTGYLHIGGARTALFNWLYARGRSGQMLLRIEDTDRERSTPEAIAAILDGLSWLGLQWDGDPVFQHERLERHAEIAQRLLAEGKAYRCYASAEELAAMRERARAEGRPVKYDGTWRDRDPADAPKDVPPVIRFKAPLDGETIIEDRVQGKVRFSNSQLDDLIILRSNGTPTYNLSVVVDDHDMGITHVIRGDDHLNNTPRQMNIFRALGAEPPRYAHLPMILGPDGAKLSKRHGAVSVMQYREDGFLPQAVINYLVRLGWSHGDQEIFTRDEMVAKFEIADVNQSASAINPDKLLWLNQHYIKESDPDVLADELAWHFDRLGVDTSDGPPLAGVVRSQQERAKTVLEMAQSSRFFYQDFDGYEEKAARKNLNADTLGTLQALTAALAGLDDWTAPAIHACIEGLATGSGLKLGQVAQPLRVAVAFGPVSPPIDQTVALLGRDCTLARLERAIASIPTD